METKRTTISFDVEVLEALRARAAEVHQSISHLVNEAVRARIAEDLEDLAVFEERADEPTRALADVVADLKIGHR
ncbi:MAG: CopG family transcriptional regulator [Deferrisomatales bacterium]